MADEHTPYYRALGKATVGLENELWRRWSDGKLGEWAELILQTFRYFTYVPAHSATLPSLYLRHSSFSNPSVASPTSQLILESFFRFSYITDSLLMSPGEPSMICARGTIPAVFRKSCLQYNLRTTFNRSITHSTIKGSVQISINQLYG